MNLTKKNKKIISKKTEKIIERKTILFFLMSIIGSISFILIYTLFDIDQKNLFLLQFQNFLFGCSITLSMLGIGIGIIYWTKNMMSEREFIEKRNYLESSNIQVETNQLKDEINQLIEKSKIKRRPLLKNTLLGAIFLAPISGLFTLNSLKVDSYSYKTKIDKLRHTLWSEGIRLIIEHSKLPILASDVNIGSIMHVIPENLSNVSSATMLREKAKSVILLTKLDLNKFQPSDSRKNWHYKGIVAYSKICTHVGCPVTLYEQKTNHLLCPCHQSTFDLLKECNPIFGPAKRPLPQLPISVDQYGYLIAKSDFQEPVGPSYWERG